MLVSVAQPRHFLLPQRLYVLDMIQNDGKFGVGRCPICSDLVTDANYYEQYENLERVLRLPSIQATCLDLLEHFVCAIFQKQILPVTVIAKIQDHTSYAADASKAALQPVREYSLPALPSAWKETVDGIFETHFENFETFSTRRIQSFESLHTLEPGKWLNDEVVAEYAHLLSNVYPNVHIANTFMLVRPEAKHSRFINEENYVDLLTSRAIIPIHLDYNHWTFACIWLESPTQLIIEYYDSNIRHESIDMLPRNLMTWIEKTFPPSINHRLWRYDNPQQENGYDCGVFMLMGMRMRAAGWHTLSQEEVDEIIPVARHRISAEIIAGHLNPTIDDLKTYKTGISTGEIGQGMFQGCTLEAPSTVCQMEVDGQGDILLDVVPPNLEQPAGSRSSQTPEIEMEDSFSAVQPASLEKQENLPAHEESKILPIVASKSRSKASSRNRQKKDDEIARLAGDSFAAEDALISNLKAATIACRARSSEDFKDLPLALLWTNARPDESIGQNVWHRRARLVFARQWATTDAKCPGGHRRARIEWMQKQLQLKGSVEQRDTEYKAARTFAKRCSFWLELMNRIPPSMRGCREVVLYANSEPTSSLERMSDSHREEYFRRILSRIEDPSTGVMENLEAASPLYEALLRNDLPGHRLPIESHFSAGQMSFEKMVSLDPVPTKLAIPPS
jgi:hypothetical protein